MNHVLQIHVRAQLPASLEPLWTIARNVWWSWNVDAVNLFRRIDPVAYEQSGPCPLRLLNELSREHFDRLAQDQGFLDHLTRVKTAFESMLQKPPADRPEITACKPKSIAYFSMEFALHESIPLYSGGLGVLAGDHLKTASDLALPLIGVGLFYNEGYFNQTIGKDGWQRENYSTNDPFYMPMELVRDSQGNPLTFEMKISGEAVNVQIWKLHVGRIPLFLLDTNLSQNSDEARQITSRLYAGGQDFRLRQEILLGIGGVFALQAMGLEPQVFHLNEGHSAFLTLARISQAVSKGLSWQQALHQVQSTQIFTVHTPLPAGNDSFPIEKVKHHMGSTLELYGLPDEQFYSLGKHPEHMQEFSMPVFALRTSHFRNGVSELHGQVSRRIWKSLWPHLNENETPVHHVTNGVHTRTWMSNELADLCDMYLGRGWDTKLERPETWERILGIPDSEFWDVHLLRKSRLTSSVIKCMTNSERMSPHAIAELRQTLRPQTLTIGFARRFVAYKRGTLMFRNIERLKRILNNPERPVQILIAGKAHPNDNHGKEIIQQVVRIIEREKLTNRVLFLENYDMNLAHRLVRGVDVWLNTPVRTLEASGTSGMKVALNGGLHLSILDGWWDEAHHPDAGWAIGSRESHAGDDLRDDRESEMLYDILEHEVVPLYYSAPVPSEWIRKMKNSVMRYAPAFSAQRMVLDYFECAYAPALANATKTGLYAENAKNNLSLHEKNLTQLRSQWNKLEIRSLEVMPKGTAFVGEPITVRATIRTTLPHEWIDVCLVPTQGTGAPMCLNHRGSDSENTYLYEGIFNPDQPCMLSLGLRVTPSTRIFPEALDLQLVAR
jgi:starch phosphorylase